MNRTDERIHNVINVQTEDTAKDKPKHATLRLIGILLWTLLPCVAIQVGMCQLKSAVWSFALYHCICIVPAIIWGRKHWQPGFTLPSATVCLRLAGASVLFSAAALVLYETAGSLMLSNDNVVALLKQVGYSKSIFLPLSLYAIIVNPIVEELFWRGVVLNVLDKENLRWKHFGIVYSSLAYAAFHYTIFRLVMFPGWAEAGTLLLAVYGAFLAVLYRRTGSIVTTSIAHGLLTDLAAIVLILDLFSRYPGIL